LAREEIENARILNQEVRVTAAAVLKRTRDEALLNGIPPTRQTAYKCGNTNCLNKYNTHELMFARYSTTSY
jgi:hypothetical protein